METRSLLRGWTLFEVDRRGVTRVVILNSRTNNKRRVNTFVYEELLIIDNFSEIYFLKTKKGKVKKGYQSMDSTLKRNHFEKMSLLT